MKALLYKKGVLIESRTISTDFLYMLAKSLESNFGHLIDVEQLIQDIDEECAPTVDHPHNGMRFEFLK